MRSKRTFITLLCAVFSLLHTFQQRVISSSEIIFGFEPRPVKHSRSAAACVGVRLSKPLDGIGKLCTEASTFEALLLEITFQFRIISYGCSVQVSGFSVATGFD